MRAQRRSLLLGLAAAAAAESCKCERKERRADSLPLRRALSAVLCLPPLQFLALPLLLLLLSACRSCSRERSRRAISCSFLFLFLSLSLSLSPREPPLRRESFSPPVPIEKSQPAVGQHRGAQESSAAAATAGGFSHLSSSSRSSKPLVVSTRRKEEKNECWQRASCPPPPMLLLYLLSPLACLKARGRLDISDIVLFERVRDGGARERGEEKRPEFSKK